jgi:3-(methylthio)propionyl---CoA ligase
MTMARPMPLAGQMMDRPLLISQCLDYGAEIYPHIEIVSSRVEGDLHRTTYADLAVRARRLAAVLIGLGVKPGDRVATLAWNGHRHLELYYAISGIGAVCHTINPRLFPEQMVYIFNHAEDVALFYDMTFAPLVEKLRPALKSLRHVVAMTDAARMPAEAPATLKDQLCYETLMAAAAPIPAWPDFDENTAAGLCYTSGTTAEPKGALYSHRSTVLHALFTLGHMGRSFGPDRSTLPVVPLFHVNAWGTPYIGPLTGTKLVMPGPRLDGASLFELLDAEQVFSSWGVPTVWTGLLAEMKKRGRRPVGLKEIMVGGSAPPRAMVETFERDYDINVLQGWGMTEMSPIGTLGRLLPEQEELPFENRINLKVAQGKRMFGVDMKIVDAEGHVQPHDGAATGELYVRGPSVVSGYFRNEAATKTAIDKDGWFATGDVAKITADGFLTVVDRAKDLVKSGGEWISSIDVESAAMSTPGLMGCAVIGVPDDKWGERPLLIAVKAEGATTTKEQVLATLAGKLAKWQIPDDVVFVAQLPMTATGKISKKDLRVKYAKPLESAPGKS